MAKKAKKAKRAVKRVVTRAVKAPRPAEPLRRPRSKLQPARKPVATPRSAPTPTPRVASLSTKPIKPTGPTKPTSMSKAGKASESDSDVGRDKTTKAKTKKPPPTDQNRGGHFYSQIKMWQLLHADGGRTLFNKQQLAERYFANIEHEERPDPEFDACDEVESSDDDDLAGPDDDVLAAIERQGMIAMAGELAAGGRTPRPYRRIREKHRRFVQRKIMTLQNQDIGIEDTDEHGNVLDEDALMRRKSKNPSAERWWRYDPKGIWAQRFETLLTGYGVTGADLLAFIALRDLLEDMRGTPHHKALIAQLERIKRCVPPQMWAAAEEQSHCYRHSVGNPDKYKRKSADLERWYAAALQREQVEIDYTSPGAPMRTRHLAALSTMFHREDNAIYLLGSERRSDCWGPVWQWKLDRVSAVRMLNLKNPSLAELKATPLMRSIADGGVERLDANHLYRDSAGPWVQDETYRAVIVVRMPIVRHGDMDADQVEDFRKARRRAYGWMEWCREKPFHPQQIPTVMRREDGEDELRIVIERCYIEEMASRLLRLQDCFQVIEPPELIKLIHDHAAAIVALHGGQPLAPAAAAAVETVSTDPE